MIGFAAPAGLLALLALVVPVAIHLWSRHRPARIKVGSTRMLQEFVAPRARQLRLTDIPALLIRMSLVALLALLVARPLWTSRRSEGGEPVRWLLVQPSVAFDSTNAVTLQDLAAAGWEPRLLAPGFPVPGDAPSGGYATPDIWALLAEADLLAPPGSEFTVASTGAVELFGGRRPALVSTVMWRDFPGETSWIDRVARDGGDSLFVSVGTSGPEGTTFVSGSLRLVEGSHPLGGAGGTLVEVTAVAEGYRVGLLDGDDASGVVVDATGGLPVVTVVHSSDRIADARYVEVAVATLARELRIPLELGMVLAEDTVPESDIVFWLAADTLRAAVIAMAGRGSVVIEDGGAGDMGREVALATSAGLLSGVTVRKGGGAEQGEPVWWAGTNPALTVERVGTGYRYRFASRFHQDAGTLVLRPEFPGIILRVLEGHLTRGRRGGPPGHDRRVVPFEQRTAETREAGPGVPTRKPLHGHLWLLAAAVFGIERLVALRRRR